MTDRLLSTDATRHLLTHAIPAGTSIRAGEPRAAYEELGDVGGGQVGLWEMTAGVAEDTEVDEVCVIVAGAGTVAFADGSEIALRPGVVVQLREGDRTVWTVTETLRKVYVTSE